MARLGGPELGDILTGLEANLTWLRSVLSSDPDQADALEALEDIREAHERMLWFCREAAVLARGDAFEVAPVPMDLAPLLREAIGKLKGRYGAHPDFELGELPPAAIHLDPEFALRMFERLFEVAVHVGEPEAPIHVRGFQRDDAMHLLITAPSTPSLAHRDSLAEAASTQPPFHLEAPTPVHFCNRVAQAHGGRLRISRGGVGTLLHLTLPIHPAESEEEE